MAERTAWQDHAGVVLDVVNGFTVIECDRCRFRHIVPIPSADDLERVYEDEYYSADKPFYIQHHEEDQEWLSLVYSERYAGFERWLPPDRRRLLDIGSGPGLFLLHGQQRGWKVRGVEPSKAAAAYSRALGLDIVQGSLTDERVTGLGQYDVVHLNEVLEHLPNPRAMLGLVDRLLEPGGLVMLMVPNDYSPVQAVLRKACGVRPWWVAPPHHVNYFDIHSIERLVGERFDVMGTETSFPIDFFLLMGDNYIGNDDVGRAVHRRRKAFELTLARAGRSDLRHALYAAFAAHGVGRDVLVTGRKPVRTS